MLPARKTLTNRPAPVIIRNAIELHNWLTYGTPNRPLAPVIRIGVPYTSRTVYRN